MFAPDITLPNMRLFAALLTVLVATLPALGQSPKAALTGKVAFENPAAAAAQQRYVESLKTARTTYVAELEPAIKAALVAGALDEANAINELRARLGAGGMPELPGAVGKVKPANDARLRFERAVALAQRQYATELQPALKAVMTAGDLNEANTINGELKALGSLSTAAVATPFAAISAAPVSTTALASGRSAGPGLLMTRYPMHALQKDGNKSGGYVPYTELGKPLGAPKTVKMLTKWPKEIGENAVAAGFLRIDRPGTYEFKSWNDWDRNELLIDGVPVCKFRDLDPVCAIELTVGLHPIVSVGYANIATWTSVQWKPPGAAALTEIPANLLSH